MTENQLEKLLGFPMNRREFLLAVGAGTVAVGVAACGGTSSSSSGAPATLGAFYATGTNQEVVPQAVINAYVKAHPGTKVTALTGAPRFTDIITAYQTSRKAIVNFGFTFTDLQLNQAKPLAMFLPLDSGKIPNLVNVPSKFRFAGDTAAAPLATLVGIAYRSDLVKEPPTSWLDLLDPRFRGRVGLFDAPQGLFFSGLAQINQILGGDPATLDKGLAAFEAAAKAKQFSAVYTTNQTQFTAFMNGQVQLGGSATLLQGPWSDVGAPIAYAVPKEGQLFLPFYTAIVRGSSDSQIAAAESIANDFLNSTNIAEYCSLTWSIPTGSQVQLPAKLSGKPGYAPDAASMSIDWAKLGANIAPLTQAWNQRVKANL